MSRLIANMPVTWELLRECLHLPRDTDLEGVQVDLARNIVTLTISHVDLNPVDDGCVPPNVIPKFQRREPVVFDGWGQD